MGKLFSNLITWLTGLPDPKEKDMSFFTPEQRYTMLCAIKRGSSNPNLPRGQLTPDEEKFIRDYAADKLERVLKDPEVRNILKSRYMVRNILKLLYDN